MMTKKRPILFSAPMVRAILDGRKIQTRRVVKPQPGDGDFASPIICETYAPVLVNQHGEDYPGDEVFGFANEEQGWKCPYGSPGDRLWVRETWAHSTDYDGQFLLDHNPVLYRATPVVEPSRWRPSIFMPRWASRITLEITAVCAERLQSILLSDVAAEGLHPNNEAGWDTTDPYRDLWDSINGKKYPWASNPYVWVVEFRRV